MNKRLMLAGLIFVLVLGVVFFIRVSQNSYEDEFEDEDDQDTQAPVNTENKIPLTELSEHNKAADCWISFEEKVYDITSWIPKHPGGPDKIIPYCGSASEFEEAFLEQHGRSQIKMLMKMGTFIGDFDVVGNI